MDRWEREYPEIASFVRGELAKSVIDEKIKQTNIDADVKSGKRFIAECFSTYTNSKKVTNVFVTSYVRKANKQQLQNLVHYMKGGVFAVNTKKAAKKCIDALRKLAQEYEIIVIHFDECDFGSGSEQLLGKAKIYEFIQAHAKFQCVKYSASIEEALIAEEGTSRTLIFRSPQNYRGASYYVENSLVYEALNPIVKGDDNAIVALSEQMKNLLLDFKMTSSGRRILILRICDSFKEFKKAYDENKFPELSDTCIDCDFVTSTESSTTNVNWEDYKFWEKLAGKHRDRNTFQIFVIDQMCTRSTDWFCHPFLFAFHDYHGETAALNTIIQSNLRVAYYVGKKNQEGEVVYPMTDHPIRLYGCVETIEYVAGRKTLDQISRKVSSRAGVTTIDPQTFGKPIPILLSNSDLQRECLTQPLTDERRDQLKQIVLSKVSQRQRSILSSRTLKHKRLYGASTIQGGIHTVHKAYIEGRGSKPGGGTEQDIYDMRDQYFFIDIAREDSGTISKGTAYITYGLPDEDEQDQGYNHHIRRNRDGSSSSIFGH